jgi:hypothetical protein
MEFDFNYGELVKVWNDRFIVREIITSNNPRVDELDENFYQRWNDEMNELDWTEDVFYLSHDVFIDVVKIETMKSEIIIGGTKELGDRWSDRYDSEEELEESVDVSTQGERLWFRVGIDVNGGEFVTYSNTPESVV